MKGFVQLAYHKSKRKDEPKQIADAWKFVSKLAKDFETVHHNKRSTQTPDTYLEWLEICVQSICEIIEENIEHMFDQITENQNTITSKLNTFYAMLLQNLSNQYSHQHFRGQTVFLTLFDLVFSLDDVE